MKTEGFEQDMMKSLPTFSSNNFRRPSVDGGAQTCGTFSMANKTQNEVISQPRKRRGVSNQSTRKIIGGSSRREVSYDRDLEHVPKIVQKKPVGKKVPVKPPSGQKRKRTGPSKYM